MGDIGRRRDNVDDEGRGDNLGIAMIVPFLVLVSSPPLSMRMHQLPLGLEPAVQTMPEGMGHMPTH
jgi:hypothetical protein